MSQTGHKLVSLPAPSVGSISTPPPPPLTPAPFDSSLSQYRPSGCTNPIANLPVANLTHIALAFAYLNSDYSIRLTEPGTDPALLATLTTTLKAKNPSLKVLISLGGATMTAPTSPYRRRFSNMVASARTRAAFIKRALSFTAKYRLDGLEIDWEFPGSEGTDAAGLAALAAEFRAAAVKAGRQVTLSLAVPAAPSMWGAFNSALLAPHVDFVNVMAYDFQGPWSNQTGHHVSYDNPVSDAPDALAALQHYINGGMPPEKINLAFAAYGRTWTLAEPLPTATPNTALAAAAIGPGAAGRCTRVPGILSWLEIKEILGDKVNVPWVYEDKSPHLSAIAVYGPSRDQFASFELRQTMYAKQKKALALGVRGFALWAADMDDQAWSLTRQLTSIRNPGAFKPPPYVPIVGGRTSTGAGVGTGGGETAEKVVPLEYLAGVTGRPL